MRLAIHFSKTLRSTISDGFVNDTSCSGRNPTPASMTVTKGLPMTLSGRVVGVVVDDKIDPDELDDLFHGLRAHGARVLLITAFGGELRPGFPIHRTLMRTSANELDALIIGGGSLAATRPKTQMILQEVFAQGKTIGAWGDDGISILASSGVPPADPRVVTADMPDAETFVRPFARAMASLTPTTVDLRSRAMDNKPA